MTNFQHYLIVRIHQSDVDIANYDPADQCYHRYYYHPRNKVTSNLIGQLLTRCLSRKYMNTVSNIYM